MVHPLVRDSEEEVSKLIALFNRHLSPDGFELSIVGAISGRPLFAGIRTLAGADGSLREARKVADELLSTHVTAQITRMQDSIVKEPALAIGSAKEFVESICKGILDARKVERTGNEKFPALVTKTRSVLGLAVNPKSDVTLRSLHGALGTITTSIAELRSQIGTGHGGPPGAAQPPVAVARLAVGAATALGVFLWDSHRDRQG
jgi:hypothetical protein